jgi:hypothetical protein
MENQPDIIAANYCISFVDLLGQRAEYKGEALLPQSESDRRHFLNKIKKTINPIYHLQKDASQYTEAALNYKGTLKNTLSEDQQELYDQMREIKLKQQRWSDGLVYFVSLQQEDVKCPIHGIFHILGTVGSLCFVGLCRKHPIRGSVDISWGVELHPGELYGAAVANAYELESEIAQYPRIVIGERVVEYLEAYLQNPDTDMFNELNRSLAERCLGMIAIDFDDNYILNYLGQDFKENITKVKHERLFELAFQFVNEQLEIWRKKKNTKLSMRYSQLFSYFQAYKEIMGKENAQPANSADPKDRAAD